MTVLSADRTPMEMIPNYPWQDLSFKIAAEKVYGGTMMNINTGTGYACKGTDASSRVFAGISMGDGRDNATVDNSAGSAGDLSCVIRQNGVHLMKIYGSAVAITDMLAQVYVYDSGTLARAANVSNYVFAGVIVGLYAADTSYAWVDITAATRYTDVATHISNGTGAHAATAISIADSGSYTATANVETALQEIYCDMESAQNIIPLNTKNFITALGSVLGSTGSVAFSPTAKGGGIIWAGASAYQSVVTKLNIPYDILSTAAMSVILWVAKVGSTAADSCAFVINWYNNAQSALYDAGSNQGSTTTGVTTPTALSKTIQKLTLTIAAVSLPKPGEVVELAIAPAALGLESDNVIVLGGHVKYTRKLRTS